MSLAAMLAKQKEKANAIAAGKSAESTAVVVPDGGSAVDVGSPAVSAAPAPVRVTAFKLGKPGPERVAKPDSTPPKPEPSSDTLMSLDDISDSVDEGIVPSIGMMESGFSDEIPCTAPERELPADLTKSQQAFVAQLDSIYEVVHDPELFGQMIRVIMQELNEDPSHMKMMADQDVHTMIRGLRSSMGLAKVKKAEKTVKGRQAKKAPATAAILSTAEELFNSEDW